MIGNWAISLTQYCALSAEKSEIKHIKQYDISIIVRRAEIRSTVLCDIPVQIAR